MSKHWRERNRDKGHRPPESHLLEPSTWQRIRAGEFLFGSPSPWTVQLLGLLALLALAGGIAAASLRG